MGLVGEWKGRRASAFPPLAARNGAWLAVLHLLRTCNLQCRSSLRSRCMTAGGGSAGAPWGGGDTEAKLEWGNVTCEEWSGSGSLQNSGWTNTCALYSPLINTLAPPGLLQFACDHHSLCSHLCAEVYSLYPSQAILHSSPLLASAAPTQAHSPSSPPAPSTPFMLQLWCDHDSLCLQPFQAR
jgi:hypothetical protein